MVSFLIINSKDSSKLSLKSLYNYKLELQNLLGAIDNIQFEVYLY